MILDNNILFALMKPDSAASAIFKLGFTFEAPQFVLSEFEEHENECLKKSGLTRKQFIGRKAEVFNRIKLVEFGSYKKFLKKALDVVEDEDDAPYVALALATGTPIWSNDSSLKKTQGIAVLSTEDVVNLLG